MVSKHEQTLFVTKKKCVESGKQGTKPLYKALIENRFQNVEGNI